MQTGQTKILVERADWEAFDGIVRTPWGTILAAEETTTQAKPDPQVPQAKGGLVYEFFVDPDDPSKLDPSREQITPGDGTNDTVKDGIRARPALGAKSHEGVRFDKREMLHLLLKIYALVTWSSSEISKLYRGPMATFGRC